MILKSPFPWFGGKSRAAPLIWERFGEVDNYIEPFAGSLAVLLQSPRIAPLETVNDADGFICNFWRAVSKSPDDVAHYADWPVNENDLHARHIWLVEQRADLTARLEGDPDFYDAKIAGWWLWGISCWIGTGWCYGKGPWSVKDGKLIKSEKKSGITRQIPEISGTGGGVHRKIMNLSNNLDNSNTNLMNLSNRLRNVRVCCGDWKRVCGASVTTRHGITGILLDPPYSDDDITPSCYAISNSDISREVRDWAISVGENKMLRIALCGYEGEHVMPDNWECVEWTARGGYGVQRKDGENENRYRERIWFSPYCLSSKQLKLPLP
jgi:hypothetical protein